MREREDGVIRKEKVERLCSVVLCVTPWSVMPTPNPTRLLLIFCYNFILISGLQMLEFTTISNNLITLW